MECISTGFGFQIGRWLAELAIAGVVLLLIAAGFTAFFFMTVRKRK